MPNRIWSLGPSLAETLFDGGLRDAQTDQAIAAYDQSVATYRQTVLSAFQEVEDNLSATRILTQEAALSERAAADAKAASAIALNEYKAGTQTYLTVVTAQNTELQDELAVLTVRENADKRRRDAHQGDRRRLEYRPSGGDAKRR